jgi:ATP-dependent Zn protease
MPRKSKQNAEKLRVVAYHEAGHAVAELAYGRQFEYVTIVPDGEFLGQVHVGEEWSKSFARKKEENEGTGLIDLGSLVCSMLGAFAEKEVTGRFNNRHARLDSDFTDGTLSQRDLFSHWAGYRPIKPPRTAEHLWLAARGEANAIVSLFWPAIEAIAKALLEKKTLTYDEATQIHCAAMKAGFGQTRGSKGVRHAP